MQETDISTLAPCSWVFINALIVKLKMLLTRMGLDFRVINWAR